MNNTHKNAAPEQLIAAVNAFCDDLNLISPPIIMDHQVITAERMEDGLHVAPDINLVHQQYFSARAMLRYAYARTMPRAYPSDQILIDIDCYARIWACDHEWYPSYGSAPIPDEGERALYVDYFGSCDLAAELLAQGYRPQLPACLCTGQA